MQSFGLYKNLEEIGNGGMATVYRATAPNGNLVALKVLALHLAADPTARLRFEQESNLGLDHPNIVRVLDCGVMKGAPFIVMEYVVGESLDHRLTRLGTLLPQQLAPIIRDAARALDYAHARGIIHRDVKPSNILIRTNGQAMLADFGVAKSAGLTAYTATAARVGSVFYMSPEQANGALEITPASDIYSLGVTAYFALAGRHPFEGDNEIAIARMHIDVKPRYISDVNPVVPRNVGAVIMQALEKDPLRRPATAGELARALQQAARESGRARRPIRRLGPTTLIAVVALCAVLIIVFAAMQVLPGAMAESGVRPSVTATTSPSPAIATAGSLAVLSATLSSPGIATSPTLTMVPIPTGSTPTALPTALPKQAPAAIAPRKTARPPATPTRRPTPTRTSTPVPTALELTPVVVTLPPVDVSATPMVATDLPPTDSPPTDIPPTPVPPTPVPPSSTPSDTPAPSTAPPVNVPPAATATPVHATPSATTPAISPPVKRPTVSATLPAGSP